MTAFKRSGFYLQRTRGLMTKLNLNLNQFKFIHLAGTAGKGSTTAMVHEVLYQAGKKVGSYYSPHPTTSIERIRVNNKYISPRAFDKILEEMKPVLTELYKTSKYGMPSYFEIFLGIALKYFKQKKCEYVILETGCGGEFDATNIIKQPLVTAITNIGFDHTKLLGNTLEKIARTKAGIIKTGSWFITTETRPKLLKIFKNICQQKKAKFISVNNNKKFKLKLLGANQQKNAGLAYEICQKLKIKKDIIIKGIEKTTLPCRLEIIQTKPTIILDGAHNASKIKTVFENLKNFPGRKFYLVFALNEDKDVRTIIKTIGKYQIEKVFITRHLVAERKCADLNKMAGLFKKEKIKFEVCLDPYDVLNKAIKKARQNDLILITGSFYLAGELRTKWIAEEKILKDNL